MVVMNQKEEKQRNGCSHPMIIAAIIAGIFAVITALISAYAIVVASNKASPAPQQLDNSIVSSSSTTAEIAGTWGGTISATDGSLQIDVVFSIQSDCMLGQACGNFDTPSLGCNGDLIFKGVTQGIYEFVENKSGSAAEFCKNNGIDRFSLNSDGRLSVSYLYTDSEGTLSSSGVLTRK